MPCENYKDALTEAAASGADPANALRSNAKMAALRAHFESCASCRTAFAEEQALFTSIDASLHASANAGVPASLLPRLRAALDEVSSPRFGWTVNWLALGTVAALVLVIFGAYSVRRRNSSENPVSTAANTTSTKAVLPTPLDPISSSNSMANRSSTPHVRTALNKNPAFPETLASRNSLPEVLVPRDQEILLVHYAGEWGLRKRAPLVAKSADDASLAPLEVAPIRIDQLDVKLLAEEKSQ